MRYLILWLTLTSLFCWAAPGAARAQGGAQTAHATISWGAYSDVVSRGGARRKVPTFVMAYHGPDEQVGTFSLRLDGYVPAGELQNAVYQPFSPADARLLDLSRLLTGPTPRLSHATVAKLPVTYLLLQPARRNPQSGQAEQLVSFDYVYTIDNPTAAGKSLTTRRGGPAAAAHRYAPASVLATGEWYKIGVPASGVYKLDRATLSRLGLNPASLDPRRLQLYGNATGLLPQPNAAYRPDDLVQNAVQVVGDNGNASFEDSEYLLFYARGPHTWEARDGRFQHINNIYSDTAYYFLTVGTAGRRVAPVPTPAPAASAPTDISTFQERLVHNRDLVNLLRSGRQWLGEAFNDTDKKERKFTFGNLTGLVPNSPLTITASVASTATVAPTFQLSANEQPFGQQLSVPAVNTFLYHEVAQTNVTTQEGRLPAGATNELRVALRYDTPGDPRSTGYLDYLEINLQRQLALTGPVLEFRTLTNAGRAALNRYRLAGAAGATVWDVTNPRRPAVVALEADNSFLARTDTLREFVAFRADQAAALPAPRTFGRVPNQNLHALNTDGRLDLVIVTHPLFRGAAEKLANHRRSRNNLRVAVLTTPEIYNEYSSGAQDVTAIRDLMRQVYDRAPTGRPLSLLLFGDASFDYKSKYNNDKTQQPAWWAERTPFKTSTDFDGFNQNFVPTYQSRESFSPFYGRVGGDGSASYSSEDYFALLDEEEGEWDERSFNTEAMDIGVGRVPVRLPTGEKPNSNRAAELANKVVDKLMAYDAPAGYGNWRNSITLVSDDGDQDLFVGAGSELIAGPLQANYPDYNLHKIYLDLYPQTSTGSGPRSPAAERAIDESFENGSLIINYLGHGSPRGWAQENILTNASVMALQNRTRLAFLVTGTCDFSTYDDPDLIASAGEQSLVDNAQLGGAIGLFTTTRVVDAGANAGLNLAFFNRVLQRRPDGSRPGIGQVIMNSKNDFPQGGTNNRNYTLLGDPSVPLAYPDAEVALRTINGKPAATTTDTLHALTKVRLEGDVRRGAAVAADFSGTAQVTLYDKPASVMTLGNEFSDTRPGDRPRPVEVQENIIYDGQATVRNGQFRVEFLIPKDINYNVGLGKISLYAADPTRRTDAHGSRRQLIGGADRNAATDTTPPTIRLAMNDSSFASGGLTGLSPTLLAFLRDESGINTTGAGIGHEITATLDNDPRQLLVLNDAYTAEVDNFRAGQLRYVFKDLAPGPHVLKLKAWDTYNNSAEREIEFIAASSEKLALDHVLNYPNPFANTTQFRFDHNRAGEELEVQVQIFTVAGRLVRTLRATVPGSESHQKSLTWNGRDDYEEQLARGLYIYRLSVRVGQDGPTASKYEKLVLLN